jgi:hypothetical protein
MFSLQPPRHISTLLIATLSLAVHARFAPIPDHSPTGAMEPF